MMRYLIAGGAGMLGQDVQLALSGRDVTALDRTELDVADVDAVRKAVQGYDVVINTAAYTNVDRAEEHERDAWRVNALGPENLAVATHAVGARFVQVSTDYVFDGSASRPYPEDQPRNPVSAYGRTKAEGERRALAAHSAGTWVVRTAWLYGEHGPNFAKTMLKLANTKDTWAVVNDQRGQPTWTLDLAEQIVGLLDADAAAGIYHGTNSGEATWYDFARAVLEEAGLDPERITPTDSGGFPRPAPRPAYSVLGHDGWTAAGIAPLRNWREALHAASENGSLS